MQAGFTSAMTNILEVFDPTTTNWTTRAPMPTTRGGINGIAANGCFFVFGGEGPKWKLRVRFQPSRSRQ